MNPEVDELELIVETQLVVDIKDYIIINKPLSQNEEDTQIALRIEEIIDILDKQLKRHGITAEIN